MTHEEMIRRQVLIMQRDAAEYARYSRDAMEEVLVDCRAEARRWQRTAAECTETIRYLMRLEI